MHSFSIPFINDLDALSGNDEALMSRLSSVTAQGTISCHNWESQFPHRFPNFPYNQDVMFRMALTQTRLYVYWHMVSDGLTAIHDADLSPVAQDNCMEFFMQVPGNHEYWNFEVNALGALNASHRADRPRPVRLTSDELASVKRFGSHVRRAPFVVDDDTTWWVALSIPLSLVGIDAGNMPPFITGNLYACASAIEKPYYISCFPINTPKPDFHRPEFFGKLYLMPFNAK